MRYQNGDHVIIRVLYDDSVPQFFSGYVSPEQKAKDPTSYFIQITSSSQIFYREVTFYDIMPYDKYHLEDLNWESMQAARSLRNMDELWKAWYRLNG